MVLITDCRRQNQGDNHRQRPQTSRVHHLCLCWADQTFAGRLEGRWQAYRERLWLWGQTLHVFVGQRQLRISRIFVSKHQTVGNWLEHQLQTLLSWENTDQLCNSFVVIVPWVGCTFIAKSSNNIIIDVTELFFTAIATIGVNSCYKRRTFVFAIKIGLCAGHTIFSFFVFTFFFFIINYIGIVVTWEFSKR